MHTTRAHQSFNMLAKVVSIVVVCLPALAYGLDRGASCTTPNEEKATCTPITSCKVIKDAVMSRNIDAVDFAQKSQCGFDTEPLVCCGSSATKIARATCTTPNNEPATCIPLSTCKVISDAIATRNKEALDFAQKSQCGYDKEPLVCCGSEFESVKSLSPWLPNKTSCGMEYGFRVYGGELTQLWEFPWMALLRYKNSDGSDAGFKCGGTVINNRYILTAAHCVVISTNQGYDLDSVRLGEWRISTEQDCEEDLANEECADPVVNFQIEEKVIYKEYSRRNGKHDIALLRLDRNIKYSDYIQPICLPTPNRPVPKEGVIMTVAGWGETENSSYSDVKLRVDLPMVSNAVCNTKIRQRGEIIERQVCAGGRSGKDSCVGDSGGPLMGPYSFEQVTRPQWYQEGVVSWGLGCGIEGFPAVYTRVASYIDWIVDNLKPF